MKHSLKVGLCFGLTSGIITTLGLMMGLYSGTQSRIIVIGGILTIAIADSISDAVGIHISEESENKHSTREVWESTLSTFFFKFLVASSFILPLILIDLQTAIYVSIIWGLFLLSILSYYICVGNKSRKLFVILEHIIIAIIVIIITYYVGYLINITFT
jgi:VIT1/CCC1 family predicted Fe2+/Mn2+ transporter